MRLAQPWVTVRLLQADGIASIAMGVGHTTTHTRTHTGAGCCTLGGTVPCRYCKQVPAKYCDQVALCDVMNEWEPCTVEAALQALNI